MEAIRIVFIGAGNMAQALLSGLRQQSASMALHAVDPSDSVREQVNRSNGVACSPSISEAGTQLQEADAIVLAVKPQVMSVVLEELRPIIGARQLVISIAAGIPIEHIVAGLHPEQPVVRAMPNTPALINAGISGLYASKQVNDHQVSLAERTLRAAGEIIWLETENLMDAVTAVSGSGPAYFFYLLEAMTEGGTAAGLAPETALKLALSTGAGATAMALQSEASPATLRQRVTSPGGTTQAALDRLDKGHFKATVVSAIEKATLRGRELAQNSKTNEKS